VGRKEERKGVKRGVIIPVSYRPSDSTGSFEEYSKRNKGLAKKRKEEGGGGGGAAAGQSSFFFDFVAF